MDARIHWIGCLCGMIMCDNVHAECEMVGFEEVVPEVAFSGKSGGVCPRIKCNNIADRPLEIRLNSRANS